MNYRRDIGYWIKKRSGESTQQIYLCTEEDAVLARENAEENGIRVTVDGRYFVPAGDVLDHASDIKVCKDDIDRYGFGHRSWLKELDPRRAN